MSYKILDGHTREQALVLHRLNKRIEKLEEALRKISSCNSRVPGDVVDIATKALSV